MNDTTHYCINCELAGQKLASQGRLIEEIKKIAGLYTTFYVSRADEKSCAIKICDLIAKAEKESAQ